MAPFIRCGQGLGVPECPVCRAAFEEPIVGAVADELAVVEDEDAVCVTGEVELVGDEQHGAFSSLLCEGAQDGRARGGVECGECLVEYEEIRFP